MAVFNAIHLKNNTKEEKWVLIHIAGLVISDNFNIGISLNSLKMQKAQVHNEKSRNNRRGKGKFLQADVFEQTT